MSVHTPRTNAALTEISDGGYPLQLVLLCRELEVENARLDALVWEQAALLNTLGDMCPVYTADDLPEYLQQMHKHIKNLTRWNTYVRTNHGLVAQSVDVAIELGWEYNDG